MTREQLLADPSVLTLIDDAVLHAVAHERLRLAHDLHDGLAQDLAFIAAHGDRLAEDLGAEHPVAIAARRALAATRETITDLAASDAASAGEALEQVAGELSRRHGVRVSVHADDTGITGPQREQLVRIAREAIVNATQHGQAKEIAVSLKAREDELVLRIDDDGAGIGAGHCDRADRGFGLRAMRQRAQILGGRLIARPGELGGTRIEVVVR